MADDRGDRRSGDARAGDFRIARIASGTTLTLIVAVQGVATVFNPAYHVDPLVLVTMLTTIAVLFGLEGAAIWRGRG